MVLLPVSLIILHDTLNYFVGHTRHVGRNATNVIQVEVQDCHEYEVVDDYAVLLDANACVHTESMAIGPHQSELRLGQHVLLCHIHFVVVDVVEFFLACCTFYK